MKSEQQPITQVETHYRLALAQFAKINDVLEKYPELAEDELSALYNGIVDALLHISLIQIDLLISIKNLAINIKEGTSNEIAFFAKVTALHTIDSIGTGKECLPARINNVCALMYQNDQFRHLVSRFDHIKEEIKEKRKDYLSYLNSIRNTVNAHRTGTAYQQYQLLKGLDVNHIGRIGLDAYQLLDHAVKALLSSIKVVGGISEL